jgi:hypothetical protein
MSFQGENYLGPRYLWTSEELLDPEVGAVEIGLLEAGAYETLKERMDELAVQSGMQKPRMIVDLIFKEGMTSQLGSPGQPYPIADFEWETFVADVPAYCGENVPRVYVVDGSRYTAGI